MQANTLLPFENKEKDMDYMRTTTQDEVFKSALTEARKFVIHQRNMVCSLILLYLHFMFSYKSKSRVIFSFFE